GGRAVGKHRPAAAVPPPGNAIALPTSPSRGEGDATTHEHQRTSGRGCGNRFEGQSMADAYRKAMDLLYWICAWLAGVSLVLISAVIPYSVYTRYVLNRAASWPEPMAILLTIVLTFFGAAACYRDSVHMRVMFFVGLMPVLAQRLLVVVSDCLMVIVSMFMAFYGYGF